MNKRLRVIAELKRIERQEPVTFADYRAVTSFLQYLRPLVLHLNRADMYGLYGPYRRDRFGQLPAPATIVQPGGEALDRIRS